MIDHEHVREYVELEAKENVVSVERLGEFPVGPDVFEAFNVATTDGAWWVVGPPLNLYRVAAEGEPSSFSNPGDAVAFHLGLMMRLAEREN